MASHKWRTGLHPGIVERACAAPRRGAKGCRALPGRSTDGPARPHRASLAADARRRSRPAIGSITAKSSSMPGTVAASRARRCDKIARSWLNCTSSPARWTPASRPSRSRPTTTTPRAAGSAGSSPPTTAPARPMLSSRLGPDPRRDRGRRRLRLLAVRRRHADPGRPDRLPDLRRGPVLHRRPDRPARQDRRRAADRRLRLRHPHRLPHPAVRRAAPAWSSSPTG